MKICVIGDPHFANRKLFAGLTDGIGVNMRLQAVEHTLTTIADDLEDDIKHVIILGDLTHEHGRLTPPVAYSITRALDRLAGPDRTVYCLSGNHDIDAYGQSIVPLFNARDDDGNIIVEAIDAGRMVYFDEGAEDWEIHGISYMNHEDTLRYLKEVENTSGKRGKRVVLCMHHHFDGAVHGAHEFQPPGGLSPHSLPSCVELVLCGHYHQAQAIGNKVRYIGTPLQHDFGEAGNVPSYTILRIENDAPWTLESREIPSRVCPRHHILPYSPDLLVDPKEWGVGDLEHDYYRIDVPADADLSEVRAVAKKIKHCVIKVLPTDVEVRSRVEEYLA
jgi:DNA repair exonuclease SbcCD nuclease subunit